MTTLLRVCLGDNDESEMIVAPLASWMDPGPMLWMVRVLVLMATPEIVAGSLRFKLKALVVSLAAPVNVPP